jgi:hypothetical protein
VTPTYIRFEKGIREMAKNDEHAHKHVESDDDDDGFDVDYNYFGTILINNPFRNESLTPEDSCYINGVPRSGKGQMAYKYPGKDWDPRPPTTEERVLWEKSKRDLDEDLAKDRLRRKLNKIFWIIIIWVACAGLCILIARASFSALISSW